MIGTLRHRGPDAQEIWSDEEARIGLGHTRLAIVDLSDAGAQPMHSISGRWVIVYNGELYNTRQLREELAAAGCRPTWRGHSDTEVLLAAIEMWGLEEALRRVIGMFAFALWDRSDRMLHLARDRMGEKPLYYGWASAGLAFSSELKAFRRLPSFNSELDPQAVAGFLRFGYVPAPLSIYRDVRKVPAGGSVAITLGDVRAGRFPEPSTYWDMEAVARAGLAETISDETEALSRLEQTLSSAIGSQMIADVPLGAFLSGGVDSSLIVALMQKQSSVPVKTFTVGFDEAEFDEAPYAKAVARHLGTDHHEMRVTHADALDLVPRLPDIYDEPFADSSQVPTHLVCRAAKSEVTVALSGDGGDELFCGYNRYLWSRKIWRIAARVPGPLRSSALTTLSAAPASVWDLIGKPMGLKRVRHRAERIIEMLRSSREIDDIYKSLVSQWPADALPITSGGPATSILDRSFAPPIPAPEERMMLRDLQTYLPDDILVKVDRAAMAVSLETRAPFLDPRVVSLAWRLPLDIKLREAKGKWALRQVLFKYVPAKFIERPKAGFEPPIGVWLRGPLRDWAEALLDPARLRAEGCLDACAVERAWREHKSGRRDWKQRLWTVLMFQAWLERQAATA